MEQIDIITKANTPFYEEEDEDDEELRSCDCCNADRYKNGYLMRYSNLIERDGEYVCKDCYEAEEEENRKKEAQRQRRNQRRRELYQLKKAEKKAMEAGEKTASEIVANGFH
jgi:hypothetical protein